MADDRVGVEMSVADDRVGVEMSVAELMQRTAYSLMLEMEPCCILRPSAGFVRTARAALRSDPPADMMRNCNALSPVGSLVLGGSGKRAY